MSVSAQHTDTHICFFTAYTDTHFCFCRANRYKPLLQLRYTETHLGFSTATDTHLCFRNTPLLQHNIDTQPLLQQGAQLHTSASAWHRDTPICFSTAHRYTSSASVQITDTHLCFSSTPIYTSDSARQIDTHLCFSMTH